MWPLLRKTLDDITAHAESLAHTGVEVRQVRFSVTSHGQYLRVIWTKDRYYIVDGGGIVGLPRTGDTTQPDHPGKGQGKGKPTK